MNVFFELAEGVVEQQGGRYFALYDTRKSAIIGGAYRQLLLKSNRVWAEEEESVKFLKHRWEEASEAKVDMKEFMWVKLQSINV